MGGGDDWYLSVIPGDQQDNRETRTSSEPAELCSAKVENHPVQIRQRELSRLRLIAVQVTRQFFSPRAFQLLNLDLEGR